MGKKIKEQGLESFLNSQFLEQVQNKVLAAN